MDTKYLSKTFHILLSDATPVDANLADLECGPETYI